MKNTLCALLIGLFSLIAFGQADKTAPKYDLTRPNPKTTSDINSMTRMQEGSEAWNTDTNTMWRYVDGSWIDTGEATGFSGSFDDLTDVPANLDTDSTDDVTLSTTQTITGMKTHDTDIIIEDASSIQFQDSQTNDLERYDFSAQGVGFRIIPQARPTTGDLYISGDEFQYDTTSGEWRIDGDRILTTADGGTDDQTLSEVLTQGADAGGTTITNLGEPSNGTDAATVNYVNASEIDTDGINKTADFTLSASDVEAGILNIQTTDSVIVKLDNGLPEGFVKMIVEGTGFVAVEQGTITTLNGNYKSQSGEGESLGLRIKSSTEAVVLDPSDLLAYTPITVDPDAQALITAIGTLTPTQETAVNNLFTTWKSSTYYSKLLEVNGFIGGTAAEHKWNFVNPSDLDSAFRLTFTGTWTHDANGITGDGSTAYADTHFVPATELTATSYSFGVYYQSNTDSGGAIGVRDGAGGSFLAYYPNFSNTFYSYMGDDANPVTVASIGTTKGLYSSTQNGGTTHKAFRNGVQIGTTNTGDNTTAFGLLAEPFYIGALNEDGVAGSFSNRTISFFFIAEGLTDAEMLHFYNSIEAYQTELSR